MSDKGREFLSAKKIYESIKEHQRHFVPFLGAGVSSLEPSEFTKGGDIKRIRRESTKKCMGELRMCPGAVVKYRTSQLLTVMQKERDATQFIESFFYKKYSGPHDCSVKKQYYTNFNQSQKEKKIQQLNVLLLDTLVHIAHHIKKQTHFNKLFVDPLSSYCEIIWEKELSDKLEPIFSQLFQHLLTMHKKSFFCHNKQYGECNIADCGELICQNLLLDEIENNILGMAIIFIKPYSKFKLFIEKQNEDWKTKFKTFQDIADDWRPFLDKIEEDDKRSVLGNTLHAKAFFFFGHYEWLADLFWHTLRFDDCKIPTAHELSFRIALKHTAGLMMPGELAQSAELAGLRNLKRSEMKEHCQLSQEVIRPWLRMCEENSLSKYNSVHTSIAQMLQLQQKCMLKRTGSKKIQRCFAMTTNYDNCLERSLITKTNEDCTVIFPISIFSTDKNSEEIPELRWCLYDVKKSINTSELDSRDFRFLPYRENIDLKTALDQSHASSYIVVKLHGSPLYKIDKKDLNSEIKREREDKSSLSSWTSDDYIFQHAVVLSESGYLSYLQNEEQKHSFVIDQIIKGDVFRPSEVFEMETKRDLWFFGYSLKDWNIRLSLYNYVTRAGGGLRDKNTPENNTDDEIKKYALFKDIDPYQTAILTMLKVDYAKIDLESVGEIFFRSATFENN